MDNNTYQVASQSDEGVQRLSLTAEQLPAKLYTKYRAVRILAVVGVVMAAVAVVLTIRVVLFWVIASITAYNVQGSGIIIWLPFIFFGIVFGICSTMLQYFRNVRKALNAAYNPNALAANILMGVMAASVIAGAVYVIVKFAVEAAENSAPFIIDTFGLALFVLFGLLAIVVTVLYNAAIREIAEWRRASVNQPQR